MVGQSHVRPCISQGGRPSAWCTDLPAVHTRVAQADVALACPCVLPPSKQPVLSPNTSLLRSTLPAEPPFGSRFPGIHGRGSFGHLHFPGCSLVLQLLAATPRGTRLLPIAPGGPQGS